MNNEKKITFLVLLLLLTNIGYSIESNSIHENLNQINSKVDETNFTLTTLSPLITIFKSNISPNRVSISLSILEGEVYFIYETAKSVDYPCCTQETFFGNNNYSIDLTNYLNLSLATDYFQNGTQYYKFEKASGSYSIRSITSITFQTNNNPVFFDYIYLWSRSLFPIFVFVLVILGISFYFLKKRNRK